MNEDRYLKAQVMADQLELNAEFFRHVLSGRTTAQASQATGIAPGDLVKTLILYAKRESLYVGAIILGTDRLDVMRLAHLTEVHGLRFATAIQVESLTGYAMGGVPPFAVAACDRYLMDCKVVAKQYAVGAGGDEFCAMRFNPATLARVLRIQQADLSQ